MGRLTLAALGGDGVAPVPLATLFTTVSGRVVQTAHTLARSRVTARRVMYVDVTAAVAQLAAAAHLPRVTPVTEVATTATRQHRLNRANRAASWGSDLVPDAT